MTGCSEFSAISASGTLSSLRSILTTNSAVSGIPAFDSSKALWKQGTAFSLSGPAGCNAIASSQIPNHPELFIGRSAVGSDCPNQAFTLFLGQMDWTLNKSLCFAPFLIFRLALITVHSRSTLPTIQQSKSSMVSTGSHLSARSPKSKEQSDHASHPSRSRAASILQGFQWSSKVFRRTRPTTFILQDQSRRSFSITATLTSIGR